MRCVYACQNVFLSVRVAKMAFFHASSIGRLAYSTAVYSHSRPVHRLSRPLVAWLSLRRPYRPVVPTDTEIAKWMSMLLELVDPRSMCLVSCVLCLVSSSPSLLSSPAFFLLLLCCCCQSVSRPRAAFPPTPRQLLLPRPPPTANQPRTDTQNSPTPRRRPGRTQ